MTTNQQDDTAAHTVNYPLSVGSLIAALKSPDWSTSSSAAQGLVQAGDAAILPLITVLLNPGEESEVRRRAADALAKLKDPRVLEPLTQALGDHDPLVRYSAAAALGAIGAVQAVVPLHTALGDHEAHVSHAAREALVHIGLPSVPALRDALTHADPQVRQHAAIALGTIGARSALTTLVATLKDPSVEVRWAAAEALGDIGDQAAGEALISALGDANADVRAAAATALSQLGSTQALAALEWIKQNDTGTTWEGWRVRDIAAESIAAILRP